MKVTVISESGYDEALLGLALSYYDHETPIEVWWDDAKKLKSEKRMRLLAFKGLGHNKAITSITVQLLIQAPRAFYSEWDTYKVGVTANSSSTMHTMSKRMVTLDDFEEGTTHAAINNLNQCIRDYNDAESIYYRDITRLKMNLPEGYLQERQICLNYMALQNIIRQRKGHRLKMWKIFIDSVLEQVQHKELLVEDIE